MKFWFYCITVFSFLLSPSFVHAESKSDEKMNVLFIISDDLTQNALSCYGNKVCQTPNIDKLASQGMRYTRAYCQITYCGPSRASFMFGYYPHATNCFSYTSGRREVGPNKLSWAQHFMKAGYHTARVSKIFHMGVPGGIENGGDGADDPASWNERYNSKGPEWKAPGKGETLEGNPDGKKPVVGGNTFVYVKAEGDDLVHSDGKTAAKACELITKLKDKPFFLAVGFVRPHVPFVAPSEFFDPYAAEEMVLPKKLPGDWDDIPKPGINYKTSVNMKMDVPKQKKAVSAYYASVAFMDKQVGKVLDQLKAEGLDKNTVVIFTSDHGYHLGEHDFWAKVSLHEESVQVPLIISVPGKKPGVCNSFAELIDLYPTISSACGLKVANHLQGKDLSPSLDDPSHKVRDTAFSARRDGFLLRDDNWAFIQYGEKGQNGMELFDMKKDPEQFTNLAFSEDHQDVVKDFKSRLAEKLKTIRDNDLEPIPPKKKKKK